MRSNLHAIAAAIGSGVDPKSALFDACVNAEKIDVNHHLVLVATSIEADRSAGGIYLTDKTLMEARFQGKAALVLRCGPMAFVDQPPTYFGGFSVKRGDWVIVRPSDGLEMFLADAAGQGTSVRMFEDVQIKAKVTDPGLIY